MANAVKIIQRKRRRLERRAEKQQRQRVWWGAAAAFFSLFVLLPGTALAGSTAWLYWQGVGDLGTPQDSLAITPVEGPTRLYDRSGETLLYTVEDVLGENRRWQTLDTLPQSVIQATLLWEDPGFLDRRGGTDLFTVATSLWEGVFTGVSTADVTLTGRLVRNALLPSTNNDPTREVALVAEINRRYTPSEILEWHLNTNYYGNDAYGIQAAAQVYLGENAVDLTLDEAALLAAIPLAPQYNPVDNLTAARGRQQDVLRLMLRENVIDQTAFDQAASTVTAVQSRPTSAPRYAADYALYARDQAESILDSLGYDGAQQVARGGLRITTALDMDLYLQSDCVMRAQLARLRGSDSPRTDLNGNPCTASAFLPETAPPSSTNPPDSGALVLLDPRTGELKAMVGAADVSAYQPGPVLQPFVYFTGFVSPEAPIYPATMVYDIPRSFPGSREGLIYTPQNPDERFRGPLNLRDAMGAGLVPPAADIAYRQGIDNILRLAHQIGVNSLELGAYDLLLLERGGSVSVLDIAYAYSVFASLGDMHGVSTVPVGNGYRGRDPVAVLRIETADGQLLWAYDREHPESNRTIVMAPELSYLVNDVLADQETRWTLLGQNNVLDLPRDAAVVNGVTSDRADNWTVGYTPYLVAAVHLGHDPNTGSAQPFELDTYGLNGAAPIWRALMEYAHNRDTLPSTGWTRPEKIINVQVCERSGTRPNGFCPVRDEIFIDETQTRLQPDTFWQAFQINSQTGQLATANTPPQVRTEQVYFVPPPDAYDWWQANNLPLPPVDYDSVSRPELFGSATILQPQPFAYVGGVVEVRGSLDPNEMQYYQLAYGKDLNPSQWTDIGNQQQNYTPGAVLGTWDTNALDGLYTLRLTVVMSDNSYETQFVQVTVDNAPPTLILTAGEPGQIYRWPTDRVIALGAEVIDNLQIARVEFYHNGEYLGADAEWPYGFDYQVQGVGVESFSATAFDAVGNSVTSEITVEVIRAGG